MKMKRIFFPDKGMVDVHETEIPKLTGSKVLVKNQFSIISAGTELSLYTKAHVGFKDPNFKWAKYPFYAGYSTSGIVEDVGPDVQNLKPGDPVSQSGGHSNYFVGEENDLVPLPDSNLVKKSVFLRLGLISLTAVRLSSVTLGTNVTVIGQGMIGNLAAQLMKQSGASNVYCIDRSKNRLKISNECGLSQTFMDGEETIRDITNRTNQKMCRVVIEATGLPNCVNDCFSYVSEMGEVILLGSTKGDTTISPYFNIHKRGVSVIGAHGMFRDKRENDIDLNSNDLILNLLQKDELTVEPLVTHEVHPEKIQSAYEGLVNSPGQYQGVIVKLGEW